jgi:mono/diheme cytochrome c family protein
MPDVLAPFDPVQREEVVAAISAFLNDRAAFDFLPEDVDASRLKRGSELFHAVGCVACHAPTEPALAGGEVPELGASAVGLGHVAQKYSLASLSDFLFQPLRVRPSGRMPDMGLSRVEAEDIASYLLEGGAAQSAPAPRDAELVEFGGNLFRKLSCASCHALEGMSPPRAVTTGRALDLSRGCLSSDSETSPRYQLGEEQVAAIRAALSAPEEELTDIARIDQTLTAFNCIACHSRGEHGGVSPELDPYFTTSEPELGNESRIPPPLTLAGAKLNLEWTQRVLFDAEAVRPYMHTRMPQFGEENLAHLPELFDRVDSMETTEPHVPEGKEREVARDAGRELLGTTGLSCVSCHNFNGKETQGFKGIDLINSHERLKFGWFKRFVIAPQSLRPGVVMPEGWSGGVASHTGILEGDTDKQIDAIWYFLSLGRSAPDPRGLSSVSSRLVVGDTTRTYRGRSNIAGFRGIAVGFPGGLNYAFDANNGTLSGLWRGDFVSARWDGQGAGGFNPAARPVRLAQDLSIYTLGDHKKPWPLKPFMDDENPVNPDPQYPRNLGYRFRGYYLDEEKVPTFMYSMAEIYVEDRSVAILDGERPILRRTLTFTIPKRRYPNSRTVFFRALTGKIEVVSAYRAKWLVFKTEEVQVSATEHFTSVTRKFGEEEDQEEVLLILELPGGTSTFEVDYELLR